jgi:hypothetical protein
MHRDQVASTNVSSIGYDPASQTLEVEFHSGHIYQYYNVSDHTYEQLMQSPSKGQFLNIYVKNSHAYSRTG